MQILHTSKGGMERNKQREDLQRAGSSKTRVKIFSVCEKMEKCKLQKDIRKNYDVDICHVWMNIKYI